MYSYHFHSPVLLLYWKKEKKVTLVSEIKIDYKKNCNLVNLHSRITEKERNIKFKVYAMLKSSRFRYNEYVQPIFPLNIDYSIYDYKTYS